MTHGISTPRAPGYWEAVEADYLAGHKLRDIFARHGLTKGEFDHHRRQANWPMRHTAPVNRERLAGRLYWLINRHVAAMERAAGAGSPADVAMLNQLVGSLTRLIRFEAGSGKADAARDRGRDLQDIRDKLVRRIEELKRN